MHAEDKYYCKVVRVKQMAGSNHGVVRGDRLRDNSLPTPVLSNELRVLSRLLKASLSICNIDSARFASCYNHLQASPFLPRLRAFEYSISRIGLSKRIETCEFVRKRCDIVSY